MSIKEKLESMRRNSIVLKIAKKEKYIKCATRFGGQPDVPSDFVWPTFEGESYDGVVKDRPLTFIAQFNCADLAPNIFCQTTDCSPFFMKLMCSLGDIIRKIKAVLAYIGLKIYRSYLLRIFLWIWKKILSFQ